MDRKSTINLILELGKHPPLTKGSLDEFYLFGVLNSNEVPKSRKFYQKIGDNRMYIHDPAIDLDHYLLLRRILRNDVAAEYVRRGYKQSQIKEAWELVARVLGIYDSDVITRKLREDQEILGMMEQSAQNGHAYSLLAALETRDKFSTKISKRPLVVIPSADIAKLVEWETTNAEFSQQEGKKVKPISKEQYLGN